MSKYTAPTIVIATPPAAKGVCNGVASSFSFDVAAAGATALVVNDTALCSMSKGASGYTVSCASVAATSAVEVVASFGEPWNGGLWAWQAPPSAHLAHASAWGLAEPLDWLIWPPATRNSGTHGTQVSNKAPAPVLD